MTSLISTPVSSSFSDNLLKSFARHISQLEQILTEVPSNDIDDALQQNSICQALDLVAIAKQDSKADFFKYDIAKKYFGNNKVEQYKSLKFIDHKKMDVDVDMLMQLEQSAQSVLDIITNKEPNSSVNNQHIDINR